MHGTLCTRGGAVLYPFFLLSMAFASCPPGDLTGDCRVSLSDVAAFASQWLDGSCAGSGCADLTTP
ncbi:MAG: hypothetical protein JXA82_11490, partial [Sedimentisphaerales bacterium]|nr:hypothetical protein [Sedimentisphaerales bacterium]